MINPINKLTGPGVDPEERRLRLRKVADKYKSLNKAVKFATTDDSSLTKTSHPHAAETQNISGGKDFVFGMQYRNPKRKWADDDWSRKRGDYGAMNMLKRSPKWVGLRNAYFNLFNLAQKRDKAKDIVSKYTDIDPKVREYAKRRLMANRRIAFNSDPLASGVTPNTLTGWQTPFPEKIPKYYR